MNVTKSHNEIIMISHCFVLVYFRRAYILSSTKQLASHEWLIPVTVVLVA